MAHRQGKKEAFKLFKKGCYPPDIAASLGINLRTCQRWFKEFQGNTVATSQFQKSGDAVSVALVENIAANPEVIANSDVPTNPTYYPSKTWVNSAEILANEHFNTHRNIRLTLTSLLDNQLQSPDNLRAIHTLSLAVTRHLQGEREAVSLHLLDINRATEMLQSYGFAVTRLEDENNHLDNG